MEMVQTVTLKNAEGLHARPAGLFVKKANEFKAQVRVRAGGQAKNGKSIMALMSLGLKGGAELTIEADGEDAQPALAALIQLIESKFHT